MVLAVLVPSESCEEGIYSRPQSLACIQLSFPASSHPFLSVHVCVQISSAYKDTSHTGLWSTLMTSFSCNTSVKTLSPNTVTFWVIGGLRLQHRNLRSGDTVQPVTLRWLNHLMHHWIKAVMVGILDLFLTIEGFLKRMFLKFHHWQWLLFWLCRYLSLV